MPQRIQQSATTDPDRRHLFCILEPGPGLHHQRLELLDLVSSTNPSFTKSNSTIPEISDHDIIVTDFDTKPHVSATPPRKIYKFHKADWDTLKEELDKGAQTVVKQYNNGDGVATLWTSFRTLLQKAMDRSIPSRLQKKRTSLPWLTHSIQKMLKRKQRLFRRAKQTNNWTAYHLFQKHSKRECRKVEWSHINGKIKEGLESNNTKPFWNLVKRKRQDNSGVAPLKEGGQLVNDSRGKARLLLQQFKSVFTKLTTASLPPLD